MTSGDGEFFEEAGLVVSKEVWRKKEIRHHTKHVYTQRKCVCAAGAGAGAGAGQQGSCSCRSGRWGGAEGCSWER